MQSSGEEKKSKKMEIKLMNTTLYDNQLDEWNIYKDVQEIKENFHQSSTFEWSLIYLCFFL